MKLKIKFKLLLSSILTMNFVSGICVTASAENSLPHFSMRGGYAEENSVTSVIASFDDEISLAAYSVSINFNPEQLEFVSACNNTGYGNFYYNNTSDDSVTFVWSDSKDCSLSGDVFNIEFKTKGETAGQTIPINVGHSVSGNDKMEEVPFEASGCEIYVLDNYKWGDANNDGIVSVSDVTAINKFNIDSEKYSLTDEMLINGDTDKNNIINSDDSKAILEYLKSNVVEENLYE